MDLHPLSSLDEIAVLRRLRRYLTLEQIRSLLAHDFDRIVALPHGPDVRLHLSRVRCFIPDVQMEAELWTAWSGLAGAARAAGDVGVFFERSFAEFDETGYGVALSEIEPNRRFPYRREGVVELGQSTSDFAGLIDQACAVAINSCLSDGIAGTLMENTMTGEVLSTIAAYVEGVKLALPSGRALDIRFDAFKRNGADETAHGDIAFIVSRNDGDYDFVGVGYVEAKRRYPKSNKLDHLDEVQLYRIAMNDPHALLAIYEIESGLYQDCMHVAESDERVAILPIRQVLSDFGKLDKLCRFSSTLGHQIAARYLNGADLHLNATLADSVLVSERADYLAMVTVGGRRRVEDVKNNEKIVRVLRDFSRMDDDVQRIKSRKAGRGRSG